MINIRSCCKSFDQFIANFCHCIYKFSHIILTETWLTQEKYNTFSISGFYCYKFYHGQCGGGIKVYVKNGIESRILENFMLLNHLFELLTVELLFDNCRIVLSSVYHPPTSCHVKHTEFINLFTLYLKQLNELGSMVVMGGDVNFNFLNPNNHGYIDVYTRIIFETGMTPLITLPTKVNLENPITRFSILDQIWVTSGFDGQHNFVIPLDITDHFPVGALCSLNVQLNQLFF